MNKTKILDELFESFPDSFVNDVGEFIAHEEANEFFNFENCKDALEVKCKVLAWFSRAAYKTEPFDSNFQNHMFHEFMLSGINSFLGTKFTEKDMERIYTHLGNDINRQLTVKFIESNYDLSIIRKTA